MLVSCCTFDDLPVHGACLCTASRWAIRLGNVATLIENCRPCSRTTRRSTVREGAACYLLLELRPADSPTSRVGP